jgi:predicted transcriptional regulator
MCSSVRSTQLPLTKYITTRFIQQHEITWQMLMITENTRQEQKKNLQHVTEK